MSEVEPIAASGEAAADARFSADNSKGNLPKTLNLAFDPLASATGAVLEALVADLATG